MQYNFSSLWTQPDNGDVVGLIGPNCQRLQVKIVSARRDTADAARYHLTGLTKVNGYLSRFSGVLVLKQVREIRRLAARMDETLPPARQEGMLLADYELREDAAKTKTGVFRGVAQTYWYVDKRGRLQYDDIYGTGNGYCNNQFVGTWTSYATEKARRCNWGDFRLPNSGDFDSGAGEFSPNPKYYAHGWQSYAALGSGNGDAAAKARQREAQASWWK
ncbi:MAG: hypothetical protein ACRYFK_01455 [Janthinobacterium lividum]